MYMKQKLVRVKSWICILFFAIGGIVVAQVEDLPKDSLSLKKEYVSKESAKKAKSKKILEEIKKHVEFYGNVRVYYFYDNRAMVSSSNGFVAKGPMDENMGYFGEDLNAESASNLAAMSTRMGLNVKGPRVLGGVSSAKVEFDFAGFSTNNFLIRLRQAYMKFDWLDKKEGTHALTLGQTWHPMAVDAQPTVLSMAAGAPFNPLNRSPQLQYKYGNKSGFHLQAAALFQYQYQSIAPAVKDGISARAYNIQYNMIPECYLGIGYQNNGFNITASADFVSIRPRTRASVFVGTEDVVVGVDANGNDVTTTKNVYEERKVSDRFDGFNYSLVLNYDKNDFSFKAKTIFGEQTTHLNMLGGYGVIDEFADNTWKYQPIRMSASWIDFSYGKKFKGELFLGYSKNLGAEKDFIDVKNKMWAKDSKNIDQMIRIMPVISYNLKHFIFGLEYELDMINYGKLQANGSVKGDHWVLGHRLLALVRYNF
jgi:hypothetical protein